MDGLQPVMAAAAQAGGAEGDHQLCEAARFHAGASEGPQRHVDASFSVLAAAFKHQSDVKEAEHEPTFNLQIRFSAFLSKLKLQCRQRKTYC